MVPAREILTHFSVSDEEADIYLALLGLGTANVTEIAKRIHKNRTATYFHIRKLIEKNLIAETKQGRLLNFTAAPPAELAGRFDRLTTDFKSLVPQLEALKKSNDDTPRIEVSESRAGFLRIYGEISSLPESDTFFCIEGTKGLVEELGLLNDTEWHDFFNRIVERKIKTKLILTEESAELPTQKLSQANRTLMTKREMDIRTLPEAVLPIKNLAFAYGNTVAFLFPDTKLAMTVKHQGIADSYKAMLGALHSLGEKISNRF